MRQDLESKIRQLPENPGVYVMLDKDGGIIYVGKAKNLKNRVTQYFYDNVKTDKVTAMVANVSDFYYIITNTEADALSLENNLIKKHKPRYNILLKDDKTYPYLKIDLSESFPYFKIVRRIVKDGAVYFGPFMGGVSAKDTLEIIHSAFMLRSCSRKITETGRTKECLEYHIKRCPGPCNGLCTKEEYAKRTEDALDFLEGNFAKAEKILRKKMESYSLGEEFELALEYRNRINNLKKISEKKITALNRFISCDAAAISESNGSCSVTVLFTRGGRMQGAKNFLLEEGPLKKGECLENFLLRFYDKNNALPDEILVNTEIEDKELLEEYFKEKAGRKVTINCPKRGEKRQIVKMAELNALDYLQKSSEILARSEKMTVGACLELKEILSLKRYPKRMECFDISNISGVDKVGSMTVFIDGAKDPESYRRFMIKTVEGADDFASLKEVLLRRLKKLETDPERFPRPDLIVIDGGKGQLSSVKEVFDDLNITDIDLISIAEKEEIIYTVKSPDPVILKRSDYGLRLVQRIRDEAHRFAITYHKKLHKRRSFESELDNIRGLGKKRINALLEKFGSVKGIAKADLKSLTETEGIGMATAKLIQEHFDRKEN